MSTTVKYKGNTLTTVSNATKTLKTAGKYMEGDVVLTDVSASANVWQDENGYVHLDDEGTSSVSVEALSVTQNGIYTAPTGLAYSPVTVNVSGGGSYDYFGAGTELVDEQTKTINLSSDTSFDSWSASTSNGTIRAASTTADYSYRLQEGYNYYIVTEYTTDIALKDTATLQNIPIKWASVHCHCIIWTPNLIGEWEAKTLSSPSSAWTSFNQPGPVAYYYNASGALSSQKAFTYGPAYVSNYPDISWMGGVGSRTLTYKLPAVYAKCNSTYFATARKNDIDSTNTTMTIKSSVYKTPISNTWTANMLNRLLTNINS